MTTLWEDDVNTFQAMEVSQSFNAPWLCPISLIKNIQDIQEL